MIKNNFKGRKNIFIILIFSFFFLFLIGNVSAAPPVTTVSQFTEGYVIEDSPQQILTQNQSYTVNFFVYNLSNGLLINNTSTECIYYLADNKGVIIFYGQVPYSTAGRYGHWELPLQGSNFSYSGEYSYGIKCNSTNYGGTFVGTYNVTPRGLKSDVGFYIILLLLTYGIGMVGFFGKNQWVSVIGGMSMMIFGIFVLTQGITIYLNWVTQVISYMSLGLGALFILYPLIEWMEEQ